MGTVSPATAPYFAALELTGERQISFAQRATRLRIEGILRAAEEAARSAWMGRILNGSAATLMMQKFARHSRPGWESWGDEVDSSLVSRTDRVQQALFNPMYL
jgi:hypothetical protein